VRANAYIVVEPSLHESGGYYEWAHGRGPDEIDLASLPEEWIQALSQREATSPDPTRDEDDRIPEGKRNTVLTSLAGTMRHRGMSAESIEAALLEDNRTRCDPPLDSEEVRRLASSVGRYAPDPASRSFARTDLGNAERLVARHGQDLRYTEDGRWLAWDGTRWLHDNTGEVTRRMKQTVRSIRDEPVSGTKAIKSLLDFARRSEAESRVKAAIGLAKSDPAIIASGASFDVDPMAGSRSSVHLL
jgi:putative DNA primase/helicase